MPATDYQQTSSPTSSSPILGFPILSRRRDQVHSMDSTHDATGHGNELESFQKRVAERFHDLAAADSNQLLSIPWIHQLLDAFLCCQEEFGVIVSKNRGFFNRAPMDRYISEFLERNVKALDVCNAIRDGIEQIRQWKNQLEIVLCALDNQQSIGEGQFRRAKKALIDLDIAMVDEKESSSNSTPARRNRSFGQNNVQREHKSFGNFRSLSWSVSRSWSAARQLQAIGNNLAVPRTSEICATHGLNVAVFTMNHVLLFVMWALVAAIPCQDRGLQTQFSVTRQFVWAIPILSLHEKILEESKKRERRNASGLLKEIHEIEKCARRMNELADSVRFPLTEEKEGEVRQRVEELGIVFRAVKDHLDPLERRVRDAFHRIVRSRTECLACIGRPNSNG